MFTLVDFALAALFLLIAMLYAAAGSGGGSGYLAAMGLLGIEPATMRPVALFLNILVTSISSWKFVRAGHFSARIFWPIALLSIPAAFIGGRIQIAAGLYRPFVGVVLIYAAWRMWRSTRQTQTGSIEKKNPQPPDLLVLAVTGVIIGLLSGLLGIGGGIFLGPLLIFTGWATTQETIGISALFVLLNSAAGLIGRLSVMPMLPPALWLWLPAVAAGGFIGATVTAERLDHRWIRRLLAVVLLLGGARMITS